MSTEEFLDLNKIHVYYSVITGLLLSRINGSRFLWSNHKRHIVTYSTPTHLFGLFFHLLIPFQKNMTRSKRRNFMFFPKSCQNLISFLFSVIRDNDFKNHWTPKAAKNQNSRILRPKFYFVKYWKTNGIMRKYCWTDAQDEVSFEWSHRKLRS